MTGKHLRIVLLPLLLVQVSACDEEPDRDLPDAAVVEGYYEYEGLLTVQITGNVARIDVEVPWAQLERGPDLWLKALPYVVLFSDATRSLFQDEPALAGIRVVTRTPAGDPVAQALLHRDELTRVNWSRALNIAGTARTEGTESPGAMQSLVRWGEDHTEFEYNPDHIAEPR